MEFGGKNPLKSYRFKNSLKRFDDYKDIKQGKFELFQLQRSHNLRRNANLNVHFIQKGFHYSFRRTFKLIFICTHFARNIYFIFHMFKNKQTRVCHKLVVKKLLDWSFWAVRFISYRPATFLFLLLWSKKKFEFFCSSCKEKRRETFKRHFFQSRKPLRRILLSVRVFKEAWKSPRPKNMKAAALTPALLLVDCPPVSCSVLIRHLLRNLAHFSVFITSNRRLSKGTFIVYTNVVESLVLLRGGFNWTLLASQSVARFLRFVLEAEKYPKISPK